MSKFARYAWFVLFLNLLVIIGGAYVRATGAGAGCGAHWPLCNGDIVPDTSRLHSVIEYSHRVTSGLALVAVVVLCIWAYRSDEVGHPVRRAALFSTVFIFTEALIGAGLVLLQYVALNVSIGRALWMLLHLVNTFLLLFWLTLTAWLATSGRTIQREGHGAVKWTLVLAFGVVLILGCSGAITALGDTLHLTGGISPAESVIVARLLDLRIFHPVIAFIVGGFLGLAAWTAWQQRPTANVKRLVKVLMGLYVIQLLAGAVNVVLLAPVWLQLIHLLLADLIWITLTLLAANAMVAPQLHPTSPRPSTSDSTSGVSREKFAN